MDVICLSSAQVPWMYAVIFSFDRADFPDLFFWFYSFVRSQDYNFKIIYPRFDQCLVERNGEALRSFPIIALVKSSARYFDV